MSHRDRCSVALTGLCLVLGFAVAACGGGSGAKAGATVSEIATATKAPATPPPDPLQTAPPAPSPTPLPSPSPAPPPTAETPSPCIEPFPSATPRPTDDPRIAAVMVIRGGAVVPGYLGTSFLDGTGTDAPWIPFLPGRAVAIAAGTRVAIRFGDGTGIGRWQVELAASADRRAMTTILLGGRETDLPSIRAADPEPLPAGCWVLAASLNRSDGRGSGVTYWSLSVAP